ncbi:hypothetical protein GOBAR_DD10294 [Gossypium barbadense]|nr:hypothetical protein GOBAR_DD10294 [Gossypium barbadense]
MENDLANLALTDEEEEAFEEDAAVVDQNLNLGLVGRYLTDSIVHFPLLRNTMADLWHPLRGICISDLGDRRFLFQFYHEVDIQRVLVGTSWFFNNHLIVFHRLKSGENPSLVLLFFTEFWVQVHDLPIGLVSETMAKQFGDFLGKFLEYDLSSRSVSSPSVMRIRVQLNVNDLLKRRKKVIIGSDRIFYARFQYEKLSLFCFICGKLGHGESFCPIRTRMDPENIVFGWDISVRAVARRRTNYSSRWLRKVGRDDSNWTGLWGNGQGDGASGENNCGAGCFTRLAVRLLLSDLKLNGASTKPLRKLSSGAGMTFMIDCQTSLCSWDTSCKTGVARASMSKTVINWHWRNDYLVAVARHNRNRIHGLEDESGQWTTGTEEMLCVAVKYFEKLFTALASGSDARILNLVEERITRNMNEWTTVDQLLNEESHTWKKEVIYQLFDADQARCIINIPVAGRGFSNLLVWKHDATGEYSVKSEYRILVTNMNQLIATKNYSKLFTSIWDISIPTKIKIHLWRLLKDYVPHYGNLVKRRLRVESVCPLCMSEPEDSHHILWYCSILRQLWVQLKIAVNFDIFTSDRKTNFVSAFLAMDNNFKKLSAISLWALWYKRNKMVNEGLKFELHELVGFVQSYDQDLRFTIAKDLTTAVLARDFEGLVMGACTVSNDDIADAFVAEARACERALYFARDMGFRKVVLEGDSITVIKKLKTNAIDRSILSPISQHIRVSTEGFEEVTYNFVPREVNKAAHALAMGGLAGVDLEARAQERVLRLVSMRGVQRLTVEVYVLGMEDRSRRVKGIWVAGLLVTVQSVVIKDWLRWIQISKVLHFALQLEKVHRTPMA